MMHTKIPILKLVLHTVAESRTKELSLTSFKNIVFAHLDARLQSAGIDIFRAIAEYDPQEKGFLSYAEFQRLIISLKLKFTAVQMSEVGILNCIKRIYLNSYLFICLFIVDHSSC
jgi:hypothetical protein